MSNNGIVNIHGKDYVTVAERVRQAHEHEELLSVETEVLQHEPVVIKAVIKTKGGKTFTGISSANPAKSIEKSNPYEVAETSAVGRALGFAGFGLVDGIASADEMVKGGTATYTNIHPELEDEEPPFPDDEETRVCSAHDEPAVMQKGFSKTKRDADNNPKAYWFHKENGKMCFGSGFKD